MDNNLIDEYQNQVDEQNIQFWNELCGTWLARKKGISTFEPEALRLYDEAYFEVYPYLKRYVTKHNIKGAKVLEIGLGYGTLGYFIAEQECEYQAIDIALAPVVMMQKRLGYLGLSADLVEHRVKTGSMLEIPHPDEHFNFIFSIGTIHHTGNVPKAISEIHRVLKPGGAAIVMMYNRDSYRQIRERWLHFIKINYHIRANIEERLRRLYDLDAGGNAPPHTEYVSRSDVKRLFCQFTKIEIDTQNWESYVRNNKEIIKREIFLNNIARIFGLDLYITAWK